MLALFKESAMQLMDDEMGAIVPFYRFYDALENFLDHSHSSVIIRAYDNSYINPEKKEKDVFVNNLGDSAVELIVRCYVKNEDYWPARGRLLEKVKLAYDANGIEIPFNQLDVHVDRELEK